MITAAFVRECKPRAKMYEVTCDALPGFILRVLPTGKKVVLVRYRVAGKDHRVKIGLLGPALSIEEARRRAAVMLTDVTASESADEPSSPPAAGERARVKQVEQAPEPTVPLHELAERFVRTYVNVYLKPGTAERYQHLLKANILPGLANKEKKVPPSATVISGRSGGPTSRSCTAR
ncbi:Arm DNA-binding domain-containing protein [Nannocystis pusilla]|uniref:Arm DNA-binding domain-containing protein n=1 Tax=Nannocystis pusilla TaxID=889268 RepID=UPI003B7D708F